MMQSKKSSVRSGWKYLFLLPVFLFSTLVFNGVQSKNTLGVDEQRHENSLFNLQDGDFEPSGVWQGTIEDDEVCLVFSRNASKDKHRGTWSSSSCFKKSEFDKLPIGQEGTFNLKREAGQMALTGKFDNNEGYGRFEFTPDAGFKTWLTQNGLESPEEESMIHLFFSDITKDYVTYLKQKGFQDFSMDNLIAASIHGLDKPSVEAYWQEWTASGHKEKTLDGMVAMKIHDLSPEYMQTMRAAGFKTADSDELLSAKIHDVTPEFVKELAAAGYKNLSLDDVVGFKIHGVDGDFIRSMTQKTGETPSIDELLSAKIHQVDPDDLAKFEAMGIELSMDELSSFAIHGIDAAYVESWKKAGFGDLDTDELLSAKIHGLTADYISAFRSSGFPDLDLDEALSFKIHDITSEFIQKFESAGYKDIDADEIMSLKIHDVSPEFIKSFEPLGFKGIDLDEAMSLKIHDVTPEFIRSMQEKGFKDLSLDEYVSLKIMGSANRRTRARED
jgi:hypothetical protein